MRKTSVKLIDSKRAILCVILVCAAGMAIRPMAAQADPIPFNIDNQSAAGICLDCNGPWARISGGHYIPGNAFIDPFYRADRNFLSPFGTWTCLVQTIDVDPNACTVDAVLVSSRVKFCVEKSPDPSVNLVYDGSTIDVNLPKGKCSSLSTTATATLGDNAPAPQESSDKDSFLFEGTAGDEVTVELRGDGEAGHQGTRVALRLRQENGDFRQRVRGPLPLTLSATLPADGTYRVVVVPSGQEADDLGSGDRGPLRGGYLLSVEGGGAASDLIPSPDVEP